VLFTTLLGFANARGCPQPEAAGIFITLQTRLEPKCMGVTNKKRWAKSIPPRNKQAGQLMGYRHNTGQNKTIATATSGTLTLTPALVLLPSVCAAAAVGGRTDRTASGV